MPTGTTRVGQRLRPVAALVALLALPALAPAAVAQDMAGRTLIEHGEYVARAAGCMSCHREDLSGGYRVETPMGTIVARNISPSTSHGIGRFSRDDLESVLRRGVGPNGRLFPAMPYPSYRGMTDEDITALYFWLMDQEPVDRAPPHETDLPFPFNIRSAMIGWNWLFLRDRPLPVAGDPVVQRGAYLVDHLGHCGECHTPRNAFFAMRDDAYLAGEEMDGWLSPNLTPDHVTGLGNWTNQDIIDYLRTGHAGDVAQAAGPMADFVRHASSHMDEGDLAAIAAYLRGIPALAAGVQDAPAMPAPDAREAPRHHYGQIRDEMGAALARDDLSGPESLYLTHCAACHGVTGQGQSPAYYPPLVQNAALRRSDPGNLLQVLAFGVPAGKLDRAPAMPGFAGELNPDEIAQLANFTRATFGDMGESDVTAADVERVLYPDEAMPPLLRALQILAWAGLAGLAVVVLLAGWWLIRRRRQAGRQEGATP